MYMFFLIMFFWIIILQDHLRSNEAPDQTIILGLQIVWDHRSLSSIGQKILMILPYPQLHLNLWVPKCQLYQDDSFFSIFLPLLWKNDVDQVRFCHCSRDQSIRSLLTPSIIIALFFRRHESEICLLALEGIFIYLWYPSIIIVAESLGLDKWKWNKMKTNPPHPSEHSILFYSIHRSSMLRNTWVKQIKE